MSETIWYSFVEVKDGDRTTSIQHEGGEVVLRQTGIGSGAIYLDPDNEEAIIATIRACSMALESLRRTRTEGATS